MKYFIMAASLFLVAACGTGPSKDEFREVIHTTDNQTHVEIRTDNYTSITVTDKDHNTTTTSVSNNTSSSDSTSSSGSTNTTDTTDPMIRMMNSNTYDMTAALWALNSMPTLTFFIEGDSKRYQINQNGLKPGVDNFSVSDTGFFSYTIDKSKMVLSGADVASDNTSSVTLLYKTSLYTYIQNSYQTTITSLAPVEYTIRVK